jgi:transposase InsO family protein
MDDETRQTIALWRLGVLGPLISARLEHGDRRACFEAAAARLHQRPDGRLVRLSARTIESWYYAWLDGGFAGLHPKTRQDRGNSRAIRPEVADLVVRAKREKPRRSINRIIRMLERAHVVRPGELSRSSVHRLLARHGVSARPLRGPAAERRSFLHEHPGDLWVGDALHGPKVVAPDGSVRKAYLLSLIDGATRYIVYSYFALSEGAAAHEHAFKQALLRHGRPRAYYVDLGSAYVAGSLRVICAELGVRLLHTEARDPEAKGVIERWHRTWRDEVGDELPDTPLPLAELNAIHWAWLAAEYHARRHDTTGRAPREHWLSGVAELRPLPRGCDLDALFLHRERRFVRKDGTVRFGGALLEVRPELCGQTVELRFDPAEPDARPRVFVEGRFFCDTVPLDRHRNTVRERRRNLGAPEPQVEPTGLDPLALIQREHYRRARPVGATGPLDPHDTIDDDPEE